MFRSGPLKGGLQKIICLLFRYVWHSSGICDVLDQYNLIFNEHFQIIRFCVRFHRKYSKKWKMTPGGPKSEKIEPQGEQKWAQGHQKWAKGSQKWAKREPKGAKSEPKGSKREPKWAKREPKVSQIQHKINIKNKDSKKVRKRTPTPDFCQTIPGAIFHQKSMKKSMRKLRPKK